MPPRDALVVKFGGSLLTNKGSSSAPAYRREVGDRLARELAQGLKSTNAAVVLVAGAGAFGHPLALRHGIGARRIPSRSVEGIREEIQASVGRLREALVASLHRAGLPALGVPVGLLSSGRAAPKPDVRALRLFHSMGLAIVTGGDVVRDDRLGLRVLGGDEILDLMAAALKPPRVVFATDVDGLVLDGRLVLELTASDAASASKRVAQGRDATGQMRGKLQHAAAIARRGVPVALVNGLVPGRLRDAVAGRVAEGTRIVPRRA